MTFKFTSQPLASGLYEPEGIYLHPPFEGRGLIVQFWGDHPEFHAQFTYNGVPLKGHIGLDFALQPGTIIFSVDKGRVMEMSNEPGGFGRYLKVEHSWGESLYAHLGDINIDAGQVIGRGALLGYSGEGNPPTIAHLHLGIRIRPYNRFDGWGGFTDPLPYLSPDNLLFPDEVSNSHATFVPLTLALEKHGSRRP